MATTEHSSMLEMKKEGDITYEGKVEEEAQLGESQIQKKFVGATVLVTGGTGFLGKLLIEKLLRSCTGIRKVYMLVRPKRNINPETRLEEQFNDILYDKLRQEQPMFMDKIAVIEGDVGKLNLGLNNDDIKKLTNEVNIIFNGAATVKFNETLKKAVEINVRGTKEVLLLARACTNLKAMVHISTAYSNCLHKEIVEDFYDTPLSGEKLLQLIENLDEDIINKITPELIHDYPNTYIFSKSAGEDIIRQYSKNLPVAVCRPSMVISTAKEPVPGWIDNLYGVTGVKLSAILGILRTFQCNHKYVADVIPGDMVVNCCISAAWKLMKVCPSNHRNEALTDLTPPIYNIVSSSQQPITWNRIMKSCKKCVLDLPSSKALWYPYIFFVSSNFFHIMLKYLLHWIPAFIVDAVFVLTGKEPILKKAYTKADKFSQLLEYFSTREWNFKDENTAKLFQEMCDADKQIFCFDVANLDWEKHEKNSVYGIRVYLLKDPIDTLPQAKRKLLIYLICHYLLSMVFIIIIIIGLYNIYQWYWQCVY